MYLTEHKGITRSAPSEGYRGGTQGGEITTYKLNEMSPVLVDAFGLTRYLNKHAKDETTKGE